MVQIKRKWQCRIEELATLGKFLLDSLTRDQADISAVYPEFNDEYLAAFTQKIKDVKDTVKAIILTNQNKKVTERLYKNMEKLRPILTKLEGYVRRAKDLTVLARDFGTVQTRKEVQRKDVEALDKQLETLLVNITDNFDALKDKGYTAARQTALTNLHTAINADNALQNLNEDERDETVEDNTVLFNEYWVEYIANVADAGKRVYKDTKPAKVDDYTIAALKRRIRQEQPPVE